MVAGAAARCARGAPLIRLSPEEILSLFVGKRPKPRLLLAAGLIVSLGPVQAQVARPPIEKVCRQLTDADPHAREFRSCCDLDGGNSRWVRRSDGSSVDRISVCVIWGIKPGPAELALNPPVQADQAAKGIPTGRYTCQIGAPVDVVISSGQRYSASGSAGRFSQEAREEDSTGSYVKYRINGGPFDGFQFLHRANGMLQVGRNGWGRCEPR
jgi:hypothetical protein